MRTLGIDPGTYNMGVGIVNAQGGSLTLVDADVLKVARGMPQATRLHKLYVALLDYIDRFKPDAVAIEEPFVARNVRSAMAVGQAQAVAMMAAAASGLDVHLLSPREVKMSVTGFGGSSKKQVQEMVILTLGLDVSSMPLDASDALGVAICSINTRRAQSITMTERK